MSASVNASASTFRCYRRELVSRDNRINGDPSYSCTVVQRLAVTRAIVYGIRCCTESPFRNCRLDNVFLYRVRFWNFVRSFPRALPSREANENNSRQFAFVALILRRTERTRPFRALNEICASGEGTRAGREHFCARHDTTRNETKRKRNGRETEEKRNRNGTETNQWYYLDSTKRGHDDTLVEFFFSTR